MITDMSQLSHVSTYLSIWQIGYLILIKALMDFITKNPIIFLISIIAQGWRQLFYSSSSSSSSASSMECVEGIEILPSSSSSPSSLSSCLSSCKPLQWQIYANFTFTTVVAMIGHHHIHCHHLHHHHHHNHDHHHHNQEHNHPCHHQIMIIPRRPGGLYGDDCCNRVSRLQTPV